MKKWVSRFMPLLIVIVALLLFAACGHEHSYGEWTVEKEATCTEPGSKVRLCECGEKETEKISVIGHKEVIDAGVDSSCSIEGKTEGSHCSVCNAVIKAQETVPALAHTVVIDKAVKATCTKEGKTEGSHCSVCKKVIKAQETISVSHDAPHGLCLSCDKVVNSETAVDYYVKIKTNAFNYYFSTYYENSVLVKYALTNAYSNLSFVNGYDGALYLSGSVEFVPTIKEMGSYFSGTGFLNYSIEENGWEIDDGACIIEGYGGGLATVNFFVRIYTIAQREFVIYFDDYYM
jgi:hypothetical protein